MEMESSCLIDQERVNPRKMTFFRILKIKRSRLRRGFRLRTASVSTELRRGKSPRQATAPSSAFIQFRRDRKENCSEG